MKSVNSDTGKLAYTSPKVFVYGDIRKITETNHHTGPTDQTKDQGFKTS